MKYEKKDIKKRRNKRAYLDDFHRDLSGNYNYDGPLYSYIQTEGAKTRKQHLIYLWVLSAGTTVAALVMGFLMVPGLNRCAYVILPYALCLMASFSVCWALWQMTTYGEKLREYVYEASVEKLPFRTLLTLIGSAAFLVGETVYLILNGAGGYGIFAVIGYIIMAAITAAMALSLKEQRGAQWKLVRKRSEVVVPEEEKNN